MLVAIHKSVPGRERERWAAIPARAVVRAGARCELSGLRLPSRVLSGNREFWGPPLQNFKICIAVCRRARCFVTTRQLAVPRRQRIRRRRPRRERPARVVAVACGRALPRRLLAPARPNRERGRPFHHAFHVVCVASWTRNVLGAPRTRMPRRERKRRSVANLWHIVRSRARGLFSGTFLPPACPDRERGRRSARRAPVRRVRTGAWRAVFLCQICVFLSKTKHWTSLWFRSLVCASARCLLAFLSEIEPLADRERRRLRVHHSTSVFWVISPGSRRFSPCSLFPVPRREAERRS